MNFSTVFYAWHEAKSQAWGAHWDQFRFFEKDDGTKRTEKPREQEARLTFAGRRFRQTERFWQWMMEQR